MLEFIEYVLSSVHKLTSPDHLTWIFGVAFFLLFFQSMGLGANECGINFGPSAACETFSHRQLVLFACIFELVGILTMGHIIIDSLWQTISNMECWKGNESELMLGMMSSSLSASLWVCFTTMVMNYPISTTHSLVGGVVGMTITARGWSCVTWSAASTQSWALSSLIIVWILVPIFAGLLSCLIYCLVLRFVISSNDPITAAYKSLPILFFTFTLIITSTLMFNLPFLSGLSMKLKIAIIVILSCGILLGSYFFGPAFIKYLLNFKRKRQIKIQKKILIEEGELLHEEVELKAINTSQSTEDLKEGLDEPIIDITPGSRDPSTGEAIIDRIFGTFETIFDREEASESILNIHLEKETNRNNLEEALKDERSPLLSADLSFEIQAQLAKEDEASEVYSIFQVFTACFLSYAHGANDIANSILPFIIVYNLYRGEVIFNAPIYPPFYIMLAGGSGLVLGLILFGKRMMTKIGSGITHINSARAFSVSFSVATTVLLCSSFGISVSTTHITVGSILMIGLIQYRIDRSFSLLSTRSKFIGLKAFFLNYVMIWILTIPIVGLGSAAFFAAFRPLLNCNTNTNTSLNSTCGVYNDSIYIG